jgi:hypothetical protein
VVAKDAHPGPSFGEWGTAPAVSAPAGTKAVGRRLLGLAVAGAIAAAIIVHLAVGTGGSRAAASRATADAINLRLADVPGFTASAHRNVTHSGDPSGVFRRCFGSFTVSASTAGATVADAPATFAGSFSSPDFVERDALSTVSLSSQVAFVPMSTLADIAALGRTPRFAGCFAQALAAIAYDVNGVRVSGGEPTAVTLPVPITAQPGVDPLLGLRASMQWFAGGREIPVAMDVYVVGVGHDEISLFDLSTPQPYPGSAEDHLLSLLVGRALARQH